MGALVHGSGFRCRIQAMPRSGVVTEDVSDGQPVRIGEIALQIRNWCEYEAGLRRLSNLTVWRSDDAGNCWRARTGDSLIYAIAFFRSRSEVTATGKSHHLTRPNAAFAFLLQLSRQNQSVGHHASSILKALNTCVIRLKMLVDVEPAQCRPITFPDFLLRTAAPLSPALVKHVHRT